MHNGGQFSLLRAYGLPVREDTAKPLPTRATGAIMRIFLSCLQVISKGAVTAYLSQVTYLKRERLYVTRAIAIICWILAGIGVVQVGLDFKGA